MRIFWYATITLLVFGLGYGALNLPILAQGEYMRPEVSQGESETPSRENTAPRSELCVKAQTRIDTRVDKLGELATRQLTHMDDVIDKIKTYITKQNLKIDDETLIFDQMESAKVNVSAALEKFESTPTLLNCEIDNQSATIRPLREAARSLSESLKQYRLSILDFIDVVKKAARAQQEQDITS